MDFASFTATLRLLYVLGVARKYTLNDEPRRAFFDAFVEYERLSAILNGNFTEPNRLAVKAQSTALKALADSVGLEVRPGAWVEDIAVTSL